MPLLALALLASQQTAISIGPHKTPLRFVPIKDAASLENRYHFVEDGHPLLVAGYITNDDAKHDAVWSLPGIGGAYNYGQPGGEGIARAICVPYARSLRDRKRTLVVGGVEEVRVSLPFDPTKLPARLNTITVRQGGFKITAKADLDYYGQPKMSLTARTSRAKAICESYETKGGSGGGIPNNGFDQVGADVLNDGTLTSRCTFAESGPKHPAKVTVDIHIPMKPLPAKHHR